MPLSSRSGSCIEQLCRNESYVSAEMVKSANSSPLTAEENRQLLKMKFNVADDLINVLENKAIEIGHYPVFLAIQALIPYGPLHDKYRATFFKYYLGYHGVAFKTLSTLAHEHHLTDERCRQLANDLNLSKILHLFEI